MEKRENKNSKIPGISITYYVITTLYMSIGFLLLFLNKIFAESDFFKNSSQVNVVTMALTLISIALAMFGLGYSFYTNNKSDKEDEYNTTSLHDENKSNISVKTAAITVSLIVFLSLMLIFTGFWFYHNRLINGTQLGYAGAIIGGGITLLGVYITIIYTENSRKEDQQRHDQERKEELAIQYKPMIILNSSKIITNDQESPDFINELYKFSINTEKIDSAYEHRLLIKLENVGFGEAYIMDGKISSVDLKNEYTILKDIGCSSKLNTIVPIKNHIFLGVSIYENINLENLPVFFNLKMYIIYRDLFHIYFYKKEVEFQFELSLDTDNISKKLILYNYFGNDSMIDSSYDSGK